MRGLIVLSVLAVLSHGILLVNSQPQFAPVNPTAFNPWAANPQATAPQQPQMPYYAPFNTAPQTLQPMNTNPLMNLPENYQFPPNQPMNNPVMTNPGTNLPLQYPMQQPQLNPMQQPQLNPMQQPQLNPMQQPQLNPMQQPQQGMSAFSYNAPIADYTYTTQQFRPPTRQSQQPSGRFSAPNLQQQPSFPNIPRFSRGSGIDIPTPSFGSSAPSAPPQIDPSILRSMASTIAPTLTGGASQLTSLPSTIMQQAQSQMAESAAAAGMTNEEGQAIVQQAMQRGASILTPPRPKPSSCEKMDFECQFYRACYSCFANRNQPHCMHCLNLDNCAGDLPCQTQRACPVCERLPKAEPRPEACDLLKC